MFNEKKIKDLFFVFVLGSEPSTIIEAKFGFNETIKTFRGFNASDSMKGYLLTPKQAKKAFEEGLPLFVVGGYVSWTNSGFKTRVETKEELNECLAHYLLNNPETKTIELIKTVTVTVEKKISVVDKYYRKKYYQLRNRIKKVVD